MSKKGQGEQKRTKTMTLAERMIALIDMKTKKVIEIHNYSMDEFIKQKYSSFCSLKTKNGIIVGDVHPELIWVEVSEEDIPAFTEYLKRK